MAPIKGNNKRKVEKTTEKNCWVSGSLDESSDEWWDALSKKINGDPSSSSEDQSITKFRMSRKTFKYICSLVKDHMMKKKFTFINGNKMSLTDRVGIALRRLGSGDSLIITGEAFGAHHSTVALVTWCFVEAVVGKKGLRHIQWPATEKEKTEIKQKFENIRGLPNCCGAIDTTHIKMKMMTSPDGGADTWIDRNGNQSMLLQAIVDPDMRFLDVVTGWPGKMTDSSVLENSTFFKLCQQGDKLKGKKEYIIGDTGFPLLPWLITPYQQKDLPEADMEFNKRLVATHDVARKTLVMLKDRWQMIKGVLWRSDRNKLPRIILACCILHNIVIEMEEDVLFQWTPRRDHDTGYKGEVCRSVDKAGSALRDELSLCFSGK